jgi:hypothetical protein
MSDAIRHTLRATVETLVALAPLLAGGPAALDAPSPRRDKEESP